MKPITSKRITYHVRNRESGLSHNFASRSKAIRFGRVLSAFFGPGPVTFVVAQERHDNGDPAAAPDVIWSRVCP